MSRKIHYCKCGRQRNESRSVMCRECYEGRGQTADWILDYNVLAELRLGKIRALVGDPIPFVHEREDDAIDAISTWE